jgi:hypothetical protein
MSIFLTFLVSSLVPVIFRLYKPSRSTALPFSAFRSPSSYQPGIYPDLPCLLPPDHALLPPVVHFLEATHPHRHPCIGKKAPAF